MTTATEAVRAFIEEWPVSGADPDDITAVWVKDEDQPRVLRKSDLVALLDNAELDVRRLARAIHKFNLTVGECDHRGGIGDCMDRATEHATEYNRLASSEHGSAAP